MKTALIGHSGFVGSTLASQRPFTHLYNSSNIESIAGEHFALLVCAGAPAQKWLANREPQADLHNLERLQRALASCTAEQVLLISTVDVYPNASSVGEASLIDSALLQPYGKHRFLLEQFARKNFAALSIVRLPALFGPGLKKNFIYDLLHGHTSPWTHHASSFQFYDMRRLWSDCAHIVDQRIPLVNLATPPLRCDEVAKLCFAQTFTNVTESPPVVYDVHTDYSALWGSHHPYCTSSAAVVAALTDFIKIQRATGSEQRAALYS